MDHTLQSVDTKIKTCMMYNQIDEIIFLDVGLEVHTTSSPTTLDFWRIHPVQGVGFLVPEIRQKHCYIKRDPRVVVKVLS